MKETLQKTGTIVTQLVFLVLSVLWYLSDRGYEPAIAALTFLCSLVVSIFFKFRPRPKLVLYKQKTSSGRMMRGYTPNNPRVVTIGDPDIECYWDLSWYHILEIRNNSSVTAYTIDIQYLNKPSETFIEGEIGKIEPIKADELRIFHFKFIKRITGTTNFANQYIKDNHDIINRHFTIKIRYENENESEFFTVYKWVENENSFF